MFVFSDPAVRKGFTNTSSLKGTLILRYCIVILDVFIDIVFMGCHCLRFAYRNLLSKI